jgi:hypothetical protein
MSRSEAANQVPVPSAQRGPVPPDIVVPPAPPGESSPEAVRKTQAIAEALAQLGDQADAQRVAQAVKAQAGMALDLAEVVAIMRTLREQSVPPPPLDPPSPQVE